MIKWIRARLYNGFEEKVTGHLFEFNNKTLLIKKLKESSYPPFDCLELTREDATELKDFLKEALNAKPTHN